MKRLHVHVDVDNLDASVKFYSMLFAAEPAVLKPDYAKWMLDDPRVNFAISMRGRATGLDHLGIQVENDGRTARVRGPPARRRPRRPRAEGGSCCYANSDKAWIADPQGIAWETFSDPLATPPSMATTASRPTS